MHCSDSDVKSHDNIEIIRKWHVEERKWSDVGYHFFITKKGCVFKGRSLEKPSASQQNNNKYAISICLSGRIDFTKKQFFVLKDLCKNINDKYNNKIPIYGHRDVDKNKMCPNFDVKEKIGLNKKNLLKNMAVPILALAAPFAKKLGIKLTKKIAEKLIKKVQDKTGVTINSYKDSKEAMQIINNLPEKDIKEIKLAAIDADKEMFLAEIEKGEDLSKSWKDEFSTLFWKIFLSFVTVVLAASIFFKGDISTTKEFINILIKFIDAIYIPLIIVTASSCGSRSIIQSYINKKFN